MKRFKVKFLVRQQNDLNNKTVIYIPTETNLPILETDNR